MQANGFRQLIDERLVDVVGDEHAGCVELDAGRRERPGAVVPSGNRLAVWNISCSNTISLISRTGSVPSLTIKIRNMRGR